MPFEIEHLGGFNSVRGARIRIRDGFTLDDGLEICQRCHPSNGRYQLFYFDFSEIASLTDDVVAWLSLFLRWAEQAGISVRLVNLTSGHREQLARIGISEHGTAMTDTRSGRLAQLLDWTGQHCVMDLAVMSREKSPLAAELDRIRNALRVVLDST